ncbi:hypothetical protein ACMD2_19786 [Ananas comosus]|uniref:Uncharacterized protein n=1 Tax=Ananas comosus TaxID=4615 RepID=A0A199VQL2_ANACO|nr:hypothetical protein ACMD2_19786 [Ananas comosus]
MPECVLISGKKMETGLSLMFLLSRRAFSLFIKNREISDGKEMDKKLLEDVLNVLKEDINIPEDAPGGMAEFENPLH